MKRNLIIKSEMLQDAPWWQIPRFVFRVPNSRMSASTKLVYAAIIQCCRMEGGGNVFPGHGTLAFETGVNEKTVRRALQDLKKLRLVTWARRGNGKTNVYYLEEIPEDLREYGRLSGQNVRSGSDKLPVLERTKCPTNRSSEVEEVEVEEDLPADAAEEPSVTDFPLTGTRCSDCGELQYQTPGGESCINGHGGAPPMAEEDSDVQVEEEKRRPWASVLGKKRAGPGKAERMRLRGRVKKSGNGVSEEEKEELQGRRERVEAAQKATEKKAAIAKTHKNDRRKTKGPTKRVTVKKPKKVSVVSNPKNFESYYRMQVQSVLKVEGGRIRRFNAAETKMTKELLKGYTGPQLREYIDWVVGNWQELKRIFKLTASVPTMNIMLGYVTNWMPAIDMPLSELEGGKKRKFVGEYDAEGIEDEPEQGWAK